MFIVSVRVLEIFYDKSRAKGRHASKRGLQLFHMIVDQYHPGCLPTELILGCFRFLIVFQFYPLVDNERIILESVLFLMVVTTALVLLTLVGLLMMMLLAPLFGINRDVVGGGGDEKCHIYETKHATPTL